MQKELAVWILTTMRSSHIGQWVQPVLDMKFVEIPGLWHPTWTDTSRKSNKKGLNSDERIELRARSMKFANSNNTRNIQKKYTNKNNQPRDMRGYKKSSPKNYIPTTTRSSHLKYRVQHVVDKTWRKSPWPSHPDVVNTIGDSSPPSHWINQIT